MFRGKISQAKNSMTYLRICSCGIFSRQAMIFSPSCHYQKFLGCFGNRNLLHPSTAWWNLIHSGTLGRNQKMWLHNFDVTSSTHALWLFNASPRFWSWDWVAFDLLPISNAMFCENEPCFPHLECYLPLSVLLPNASHVRLYQWQNVSLKNPQLFLSAFLDFKMKTWVFDFSIKVSLNNFVTMTF